MFFPLQINIILSRVPNKRDPQSSKRLRHHSRLDRILLPPRNQPETQHPETNDRGSAGLLSGQVQRHPLHRPALVRGNGSSCHQAFFEGQNQAKDLRAWK